MYTQRKRTKSLLFVTLVALVLIGSGCYTSTLITLDYREIQENFNAAVQADSAESVRAPEASADSYEKVISDLTDNDFIEKRLDPKLRANAYTILAISQWRSGDLKGAKATVETAQGLEFDGRDKVLIEMVLPLIYEQELLSKYSQLDPKRISETEYSTIYESAFVEIADSLKQVTAINAGDGDDEAWEIIWYVHYQRWRVLSNWRIVIAGLWDGSDVDSSTSWNLRNEARKRASAELGGVYLKEASLQELETIPADHPLRRLAESLMR